MKRVLSATQPSGDYLHLGNYFGAIRQFLALQERHDCIYCVADLHSMTSVRDASVRREYTLGVALDYLACGLDPERTIIFRQSDVPEVCELAWLLSQQPRVELDRTTSGRWARERAAKAGSETD